MYSRSSISNNVFDIFKEIGLNMNLVRAVIFIVIWIKVCKTNMAKKRKYAIGKRKHFAIG